MERAAQRMRARRLWEQLDAGREHSGAVKQEVEVPGGGRRAGGRAAVVRGRRSRLA